VLGENVDHARRDTRVRHDRDLLLFRIGVECLLLIHDLGIAAEVREVNAGFDGETRHLVVEVVRDRAHHRVALAHEAAHSVQIADVERRRQQSPAGVRCEKVWKVADLQISQSNLLDFLVLQQIKRASGALQSGSEN